MGLGNARVGADQVGYGHPGESCFASSTDSWQPLPASPHAQAAPRTLRCSQFIDSFNEIFRTEGCKILKTPVHTPVANTFAERWIGSIRRELLDRTIIWNRRQLERLVTDYTSHYNQHRPHRSLGQRPPTGAAESAPLATFSPLRTTRCNGLVNEYRNAA